MDSNKDDILNAKDLNLDFDVKTCCFEGPIEQLGQTRYTQPCMVAFAVGSHYAFFAMRGCSADLSISISAVTPYDIIY